MSGTEDQPTPPPEGEAPTPAEPVEPVVEPARCPRCNAELAPDQEWCLSCGTAARTAIAPPPNWKLPIALVAVVIALCGVAVAWALVAITDNDAQVEAATTPVVTRTIPLEPTTTVPPAATTTVPPATTATTPTIPPVTTPETLPEAETAPTPSPEAETIPESEVP